MVQALDLALDLTAGLDSTARAAALGRINQELLAILGQHPTSALAQTLTHPVPGADTSLLQRVQAGLVQASTAGRADSDKPCGAQGQILNLANMILEQRKDLKGFASANFGTEAAYVILRYNRPDLGSGLALLERIAAEGRRPPRQIDSLKLAFAISVGGLDAGLQALGTDRLSAVAKGDPAVWRAIILADNGATFFRTLAAVRADATLRETFDPRFGNGAGLASVLFDLDDQTKQDVAERAESAGLPMLAALLLAARSDLTAYRGLMDRVAADSAMLMQSPDNSGGPMMHFTEPTRPMGRQVFSAMPGDIFHTYRTALWIGPADFAMTLMNQTGWTAEIGAAAHAFLVQLDGGKRIGDGGLEDNWLFVYDRIVEQKGLAETQARMIGFSAGGQARHYGGSAQQTVDWMRAVRDIRPFLRGDEPVPPPRPVRLSDLFDWSAWVRLAQDVANARVPDPQSPAETVMVAELLLAAGNIPAAIDYANERLEAGARLSFFEDLMNRLDQSCKSHAHRPGQGILFGGAEAFRFD